MIEEVVNSILQAEDAAKDRISDAEEQAGEIVALAETEAAAFKKQQAAENKKLFAEAMKRADELAESKAEKRLAELNAESDKQALQYEKNIDKAVKIIIEAD